MSGAHMAPNAAAALAVAGIVGVGVELAADALGAAELSSMRMQVVTADAGGIVINDAYNANPTSMRAALDALAAMAADRRVAVLGEMAELDDPEPAHLDVAARARRAGHRARRRRHRPLRRRAGRRSGGGGRTRRPRRRRARQGVAVRSAGAGCIAAAGVAAATSAAARAPAQVAPPGEHDGDDGAEAEHPAGADGVDDRAEQRGCRSAPSRRRP